MAKRYDRAESSRLLLEASAVEFARNGIGGARIDKIADRAGVNKASIYTYFGKKDDLFAALLEEKLGELAQHVVVRSAGIPEYAGQLFDFLNDNPEIVRLFEQEGMHYDPLEVPGFEKRAAYFQERVRVVREALGDDADAAAMFFSIISMSYWFVAAPQVVSMVFGDASPEEIRRRYRAQVVGNAQAMLAAEKAEAEPA
ncbi:TetR/AcrR family transcriptional regulator [Leifsonia sp. NPDC058248]|uniref:TetR/AcrR family transcriptional regulator n=1 Tax=Leifsonia sp. NPDC058248 TaxID=3346402 RepID=UPI0036DC1C2C